jgi:hypothetical protein
MYADPQREALIELATQVARERMQHRPSLVSAYLIGSVAAHEPPLGGATDVDLVLIDADHPPADHELVALRPELVVDIHYRAQVAYRNAKQLRVHPWLGPELCEPVFLFDPTHFFELAQSAARGQFHRPDHVATRARAFLALAEAHLLTPNPSLEALTLALWNAANATITLTGFPAGRRRLTLRLESAATHIQQPALYDRFLALTGGPELEISQAEVLLIDLGAAYRLAQTADDEALHPARWPLYEPGLRAQIAADRSADGLWLILHLWQAAARRLADQPWDAHAYAAFLSRIGLSSPADLHDRAQAVRDYVRLAQRAVADWADRNGA